MTTRQPPKLIAHDIVHTFTLSQNTVRALDRFNLTVHENEFVTIVGTSGCGKSTFLNIAAGLIEPTAGRIVIDGRAISGPGRDRGVVFQSYTLFPWLSVRRNVEFALQKSVLNAKERQELVDYYISMVGLSGFQNAYPGQLSGGMKQRVAIARALVYHPSILLMDEPFGALDAQTRGLMQELLLDVWNKSRITVLFVTHDVDEAIFMSDRVYVMTSRPGTVKREIPIPLERPRSYDIMTTPEFASLKREIVHLIREETLRTMENGGQKTVVGGL